MLVGKSLKSFCVLLCLRVGNTILDLPVVFTVLENRQKQKILERGH